MLLLKRLSEMQVIPQTALFTDSDAFTRPKKQDFSTVKSRGKTRVKLGTELWRLQTISVITGVK